MSIQSDVEMLSIRVLEDYARSHHLSESDAVDLFHKYQVFEKLIEFIKCNRIKGGIQHSYDVVIGPVADDNTMETVQLYMSGILKGDEAGERLRYNKVNNQVSFHTPLALKRLQFECRKEVTHG